MSSLGRKMTNPFAEGESMCKWYHGRCVFDALTRARAATHRIESVDDLDGFNTLSASDQSLLRGLIEEYRDLRSQPKGATKRKRDAEAAVPPAKKAKKTQEKKKRKMKSKDEEEEEEEEEGSDLGGFIVSDDDVDVQGNSPSDGEEGSDGNDEEEEELSSEIAEIESQKGKETAAKLVAMGFDRRVVEAVVKDVTNDFDAALERVLQMQ